MKKIIICVLLISALFGCTPKSSENGKEQPDNQTQEKSDSEYIKSVWLPYFELEKMTKGNNEKRFTESAEKVFKEIKGSGFNAVTVQVRPCADAFYRSDFFPSSKYCFGKQESDMPYDPLEIMCSLAKKLSLKLEAWINPYRVSRDNNIDSLCEGNIAKAWLKNSKKKSNVYIDKSGIFFNPASREVERLIVNGVSEIVKRYGVYSVHFDDYFYPTDKKKIDKKEYAQYFKEGGKLILSDWRRENVSRMVKSVYRAVKSVNKNVRFGISPAADITNDREKLFADVERWVSEKGYVDYICPQVYFGFKNVYQPFMFTVKKWLYITKCDLFIGLPLYKAGKPDKYAAYDNKSIINEFKNNSNIIARQINYLSKLNEIKGFYIFSYYDFHTKEAKTEKENMLKALNNKGQLQGCMK
ncbi:MAG: family 10 glycosylhydrolase [Eubacterium sp.]|nr:family 10 glycosylhydrolase [Eubacterium sp.]